MTTCGCSRLSCHCQDSTPAQQQELLLCSYHNCSLKLQHRQTCVPEPSVVPCRRRNIRLARSSEQRRSCQCSCRMNTIVKCRCHVACLVAVHDTVQCPADGVAFCHGQALAALPRVLAAFPAGAEHEAALQHISVSSDSCGSYPVYDERGRLKQYRVGGRLWMSQCWGLSCDALDTRHAALQMDTALQCIVQLSAPQAADVAMCCRWFVLQSC